MAIIMTVMVLNIPLPSNFDRPGLTAFSAALLVFFISFFVIGSFWYQHYQLFSRIDKAAPNVGWRNLFFLFSLSLLPIFTKLVVDNFGAVAPACGYAVVFLAVNVSYQLLFAAAVNAADRRKFALPRRFQVLRAASWLLCFAAALALCLLRPRAAGAALLGLPFLLSVSNLWFRSGRRFAPPVHRARPRTVRS